jgi:hypothetical protein
LLHFVFVFAGVHAKFFFEAAAEISGVDNANGVSYLADVSFTNFNELHGFLDAKLANQIDWRKARALKK